jgi:hypothetical protein
VLADPLRVGPALVKHYHSLLGAKAVFQRHKDAGKGGQQQGDGACACGLWLGSRRTITATNLPPSSRLPPPLSPCPHRPPAMDYAQFRRLCLRRLVNETLELLELTGGPQAFEHIRYMIPTCVLLGLLCVVCCWLGCLNMAGGIACVMFGAETLFI